MNLHRNAKDRRSARNYRRTTNMILAVMCLFIVIELPQVKLHGKRGKAEICLQGVINLIAAQDTSYMANLYYPLADIFELLTVMYSCINFFLFALMNGQVRG